MVYRIFWFWANIAIRVFYGKIEISGLENIPKNGPLLIASNHPNGFMEPIIMACLFPRDLHFMVRGDVFRKKWLNPILVNTNQIPIFRAKDGFADLRKNEENLQEAYKALDNDAAIILFIEGGTKSVKRLRPFQKGLARMASTYIDRTEGREINVLPVAINFISPKQLRSRVVLNIEKPFLANSYFQNPDTKVQDIKKLTNDLYDKIDPLVFNVPDDRQDILNRALRLGEGLFCLPFFPQVSRQRKMWPLFKSISKAVASFSAKDLASFDKEISSFDVDNPYHVKRVGPSSIIALLGLVLLFVPAIIGLVLNIIPGMLARMLANKVINERNKVFEASIVLCAGVFYYVIYYALVVIILSFFVGWKAFLFLLAWPLGFSYLWWKNLYRSSVAKGKYQWSKDDQRRIVSIFTDYNIDVQNVDI